MVIVLIILSRYNIPVFFIPKGQIKPKADWRAVDSPKKRMNEFVLFAFCFSQKAKHIHFFVFCENLLQAQTAFGFI